MDRDPGTTTHLSPKSCMDPFEDGALRCPTLCTERTAHPSFMVGRSNDGVCLACRVEEASRSSSESCLLNQTLVRIIVVVCVWRVCSSAPMWMSGSVWFRSVSLISSAEWPVGMSICARNAEKINAHLRVLVFVFLPE